MKNQIILHCCGCIYCEFSKQNYYEKLTEISSSLLHIGYPDCRFSNQHAVGIGPAESSNEMKISVGNAESMTSVVIGRYVNSYGDRNIVMGCDCVADGDGNIVMGVGHRIIGDNNIIISMKKQIITGNGHRIIDNDEKIGYNITRIICDSLSGFIEIAKAIGEACEDLTRLRR